MFTPVCRERTGVGGLAHVGEPGRDCTLQRRLDIDDCGWGTARKQPDRSDRMRAQTLLLVLDKGQPVTSEWVNRIERSPTDHAVVAVAQVRRPGMFRVVGEEAGRPPAADRGYKLTPQCPRVLHLPVWVA
jgi:hypothetical protein